MLTFDFDSRAHSLTLQINEKWEEKIKEAHLRSKLQTEEGIRRDYGAAGEDAKKQNFIDMGSKPFSILAFHNKFFEQIRKSFVIGSYYPALTGVCALGERVLNHLITQLRDEFKSTPEYKLVYKNKSFDKWDLMIATLESWNILLPNVVKKFKELKEKRNEAIHFNPEVDTNDRELALSAIKCLQEIIQEQFAGIGPQPWFIGGVPGEIYIKKEWENKPFIKKIYLKNCLLVGPDHKVQRAKVTDKSFYPNKEITDEEFVRLRNNSK